MGSSPPWSSSPPTSKKTSSPPWRWRRRNPVSSPPMEFSDSSSSSPSEETNQLVFSKKTGTEKTGRRRTGEFILKPSAKCRLFVRRKTWPGEDMFVGKKNPAAVLLAGKLMTGCYLGLYALNDKFKCLIEPFQCWRA
nr:hypothetical protein Iba_chr12dCG21780 [Ipomoea batatas]